jgi:hypothetical protein
MTIRRASGKVPKALEAMYYDADAKLKAALMAEFGFSFPIDNCQWDTEQYLSKAEHADILTVDG